MDIDTPFDICVGKLTQILTNFNKNQLQTKILTPFYQISTKDFMKFFIKC